MLGKIVAKGQMTCSVATARLEGLMPRQIRLLLQTAHLWTKTRKMKYRNSSLLLHMTQSR